jgi:protein SYS1
MVMDWREMAGRPTVRGLRGTQRWDTLTGVWAGGRQIGHTDLSPDAWDGRVDPMRGWVIAACWLAAFGAECVT